MKRIFEVQAVSMTYVLAKDDAEASALSDMAPNSDKIARISKVDARIAYMMPAELANAEIVGGGGLTVADAVDLAAKSQLQ